MTTPDLAGRRELPDETHLAYTIYHQTEWWAGLCRHDRPNNGRRTVQVSASAKGRGGGCRWEFGIEEYELGGSTTLRVAMFRDSWVAFAEIPELFAALAERPRASLDEIPGLLATFGAVDETDRPAAVEA